MRKPLVILGKFLVLVLVVFGFCDRAFAAEKLTNYGQRKLKDGLTRSKLAKSKPFPEMKYLRKFIKSTANELLFPS